MDLLMFFCRSAGCVQPDKQPRFSGLAFSVSDSGCCNVHGTLSLIVPESQF